MSEDMLVIIGSEGGLLSSSGCRFDMLLNSTQFTVDSTSKDSLGIMSVASRLVCSTISSSDYGTSLK